MYTHRVDIYNHRVDVNTPTGSTRVEKYSHRVDICSHRVDIYIPIGHIYTHWVDICIQGVVLQGLKNIPLLRGHSFLPLGFDIWTTPKGSFFYPLFLVCVAHLC